MSNNISFEEFKAQVEDDLEIADLKIDIPSNDVSEYEKAINDWNYLTEILYNIECMEEQISYNNFINSLEEY